MRPARSMSVCCDGIRRRRAIASRHISTTFPDLLKTDAVIENEYGHYVAVGPRRRIEITQSRLEYLRQPETEIECCTAVQTLEALWRGEDIWRSLPLALRRAQLEQIIALCDELYPRLRLFLYDRKMLFSVPLTVFGPMRAAIYLGQTYFVFHSTEHIRALTRHFDQIVRRRLRAAQRDRDASSSHDGAWAVKASSPFLRKRTKKLLSM